MTDPVSRVAYTAFLLALGVPREDIAAVKAGLVGKYVLDDDDAMIQQVLDIHKAIKRERGGS